MFANNSDPCKLNLVTLTRLPSCHFRFAAESVTSASGVSDDGGHSEQDNTMTGMYNAWADQALQDCRISCRMHTCAHITVGLLLRGCLILRTDTEPFVLAFGMSMHPLGTTCCVISNTNDKL